MKVYRVTHTLHNSRDGLVTKEDAIDNGLNVELTPYVEAGTIGTWDEDEGCLTTSAGEEYYVPEEYIVEVI